MNAREIFLNALNIEDDQQRQTYVEQQSDGDEALRMYVLELLAADDAPASILDNPFVEFVNHSDSDEDSPTNDSDPLAGQTERIDNFRLQQVIGEGGMGTVYLAQQLEPIRREVALKIVKPGMGTREVIARFESERQTLAIMEHPNIARVLDAGVTSNGLPYFVMELVRGQTITAYCDERRLSPAHRMELFSTVCRAIQHAHQKGIIHRDIKPSNVLVSETDGKPVVKVIDFGLAKAFQNTAEELASHTDLGRIMGTLPYMSPEQAGPNSTNLDTRSDVYSLGILLYELLTGSTPIIKQQLIQKTREKALKIIREEEPQRPSLRLSSSVNEDAASICASRQTTPQKLGRMLRGDLDWIALKALEKERDRRYSGAAALADDVDRFLKDEKIEARPPSATYQFKKFVRRNPISVLAVVMMTTTLLIGFAVTAIVLRARSEMLATQQFQNAELLQKQGQWSESLLSFEQAEEFGWKDLESLHMGRLNAHFAMNDLEQADEVIQTLQTLQAPEQSGELLLWRAELSLAKLQDPQECLALVDKALAADLNKADQAYAAGLIATDCDEALENFRTAIELDSFHHRAHRMHAYLLVILARTEEARQHIAVAKTIFPDDFNLRVIELFAGSLEGDESAQDEINLIAQQLSPAQQNLMQAVAGLLGQFRPVDLQQTVSPFQYFDNFMASLRPRVDRISDSIGQIRQENSAARIAALPPVVSRNLATIAQVVWMLTPETMPELAEQRRISTESVRLLEKVTQDFPEGTLHYTRGLILYFTSMQTRSASENKAIPWNAFLAEQALIQASLTPALSQIHLNSLRLAIQLEAFFNSSRTVFAFDDAKASVESSKQRLRENTRRLMLDGDPDPHDATEIASWLCYLDGEEDLARFAIAEVLRRTRDFVPALEERRKFEQLHGNLFLSLETTDRLLELTSDSEKHEELHTSLLEDRQQLVNQISVAAKTLLQPVDAQTNEGTESLDTDQSDSEQSN